jgi:RNA polymerase sigma-70 factor (ECF subfamily)
MESITLSALQRGGHAGASAAALHGYLARGLRKALAGYRLRDGDIEDFTQDAIIRVFEKLDSFRGDSRFTTWAMAVAVRVALTALRARGYRERLHDADIDVMEIAAGRTPSWEDPTRSLERRSLRRAMHVAIRDELTERQRFAVAAELEGVPSGEIAARLGINRNALYKLHHDARKKLRAAIREAGYSDDDVRRELAKESEES